MSTILIAGAGIGGTATALAVAQAGHQAVVLERNAQLTELGAGIQLAPNAFHALDRLGIAEGLLTRAVLVDELRLTNGVTGRPIAKLPLTDDFRARYRHPYTVVHRADLYATLLDACRRYDSIQIRTGAAVTRYVIDRGRVTVILADGTAVAGDALVGADGIRSAVRTQLIDDGAPRVSGHTIYRCAVPMRSVPLPMRRNAVTLWAAPRRHVVHYPIAGGQVLNLAATVDNGAAIVVTGEPADRNVVAGTFASMAAAPREFVALGQDWRTWVLCDRDPVRQWTDRQVTLVGDAAHPMLQYAAQGVAVTDFAGPRRTEIFGSRCSDGD